MNKAFECLIKANHEALRMLAECESMRFALVVWCDCAKEVTFSGSNDQDAKRIARMLRQSADMLDVSEYEHGLH